MPDAFARYSLYLASGIGPPQPDEHCLEYEENPIPLIHHLRQI